jgi:hypothetical protein
VILPVGACKAMGIILEQVLFGALVPGLTGTPVDDRIYLNTDCVFRRIVWVEYVYLSDELGRLSVGRSGGAQHAPGCARRRRIVARSMRLRLLRFRPY